MPDLRRIGSSPCDFERTFDAAHINSILNHPSVHPFVSLPGQGVLDVTALLADERNVCLAGKYGCFFCQHLGLGIYEGHTNFLPEGRTRYALRALIWGINYMFHEIDAAELIGNVPRSCSGSWRLLQAVGFERQYTRGTWAHPDGPTPIDHYSMRVESWA